MQRRSVLTAACCFLFSTRAGEAAGGVPARYHVEFVTSRGAFTVEIERAKAPHGADRLYELVRNHVYDGARFYRVVPGFVVQWGYAADPGVSRKWSAPIPDDPVRASNIRGSIVFAATSEPNSRSSQLFVNSANNARLDSLGFAPLGRVIEGMAVVDHLYAGYAQGPEQDQIAASGNAYLQAQFPKLDYIKSARIRK